MNNNAFKFGAFTVPAGCKRIFITAQLEPSNGDPRIQPTGFPDVGPVLYPDPSGHKGNICLLESEPAMANNLEELCMADKYTGEIHSALQGLPYLRLMQGAELLTTSIVDPHRFASEYILKATGQFDAQRGKEPFFEYLKHAVGLSAGGDYMPSANVPRVFQFAMEFDPLSLIHGFQISLKNRVTFVGLRHPRALTASILGYNSERVTVPGLSSNPLEKRLPTDAQQAIFAKERVRCGEIEAMFSIDVGLLWSLRLDGVFGSNATATPPVLSMHEKRWQLLVAIALWKVAKFLNELAVELSLRTECRLRLEGGKAPHYRVQGATTTEGTFDRDAMAQADLQPLIAGAGLPANRSPLPLSVS